MDVIRRARREARAIQPTIAASSIARRAPAPPATTSVSWRGGGSGSGPTPSLRPLLIVIWPSVAGPTTSVR